MWAGGVKSHVEKSAPPDASAQSLAERCPPPGTWTHTHAGKPLPHHQVQPVHALLQLPEQRHARRRYPADKSRQQRDGYREDQG